MGEKMSEMDQVGPGFFLLLANPDFVDIFGATRILILRILICMICWIQNFWMFMSPYFQIPRFPDAAGAGRTLRSQPDPSPNAPRDQIRRKQPLLRLLYFYAGAPRRWKDPPTSSQIKFWPLSTNFTLVFRIIIWQLHPANLSVSNCTDAHLQVTVSEARPFFGKIMQNLCIFWIFPAHAKNGPGGPQMGRGRFFPA